MYDINLRKHRKEIVNAFYNFLLTNKNADQIKQAILDQTQLIADKNVEEALFNITDNAGNIIDEVEKNMKDGWTWERLPYLVQAILMEGVWEIQNTDVDKAITINELVNYIKEVEPDFDYKFVNALLDKFNKPTK